MSSEAETVLEKDFRDFTPEYDTGYWTKGLRRLRFNYKVYQAILGSWIRLKFGYRKKCFTPKSKTFLTLVNHTNDLDPFFFSAMFPNYVRYVAAESILRKPVSGALISHLQRPIPRKKGASGAEVSYYIRENLKNGISVAMFPEGVRSINGRTGFISPRTADLLKGTGAGLITCRIYGGYLCHPLWAKHARRGPVRAEMVHEYTAEELEKMTSEEIYAAIQADLKVNAYEVQRNEPLAYRGKAPAEGLENVVYLCPKCHSMDDLRSSGRDYRCSCGFKATLDDFGFFRGEELPFDNVCDWESWQRATLTEYARSWCEEKGRYVCGQAGVTLCKLNDASTELLLGDAELSLFSDRLEFRRDGTSMSFPLSGIAEVSNFRSTALIFTVDGVRHEVRTGGDWPVFKFIAMIRLLTGRKYL